MITALVREYFPIKSPQFIVSKAVVQSCSSRRQHSLNKISARTKESLAAAASAY